MCYRMHDVEMLAETCRYTHLAEERSVAGRYTDVVELSSSPFHEIDSAEID